MRRAKVGIVSDAIVIRTKNIRLRDHCWLVDPSWCFLWESEKWGATKSLGPMSAVGYFDFRVSAWRCRVYSSHYLRRH
jgi:hypothetical protein